MNTVVINQSNLGMGDETVYFSKCWTLALQPNSIYVILKRRLKYIHVKVLKITNWSNYRTKEPVQAHDSENFTAVNQMLTERQQQPYGK